MKEQFEPKKDIEMKQEEPEIKKKISNKSFFSFPLSLR
jgi:hypothetical protein